MQKAEDRRLSLYSGNVPDIELVKRAAQRDAVAFETIMRRHNQLLFRTARGIMQSDGEAEDVTQEAWVRAWRGLSGFRSGKQAVHLAGSYCCE